jgi:hypothetical protein
VAGEEGKYVLMTVLIPLEKLPTLTGDDMPSEESVLKHTRNPSFSVAFTGSQQTFFLQKSGTIIIMKDISYRGNI